MKYTISFIILTSLWACSGHSPSKVTGLEGKALPSFNILLLDSSSLMNTNSIPSDKAFVFFMFNTNCPFCRAQTAALVENMKSLIHIRFYLISINPIAQIKSYCAQYRLDQYPNVIIGQDYTVNVSQYFNATAVPYLAIYGKDKRLKQVLIGKVSTDIIKDIALR